MCSGRVDLEFILRAFANGMDGVFIGGCRLGECNYITHGNYHALNMVHLCKQIMAHIGLNPERLRIEFMSAGEGIHFAEVVDQFSKAIQEMGPQGDSDQASGEELKARLKEVARLVPYIKIMEREKLSRRLAGGQGYAELYSAEEIEQLLGQKVSYYIDPAKCQACMSCLRRCPMDAIEGGKNLIHVIDQDKCIRCGSCLEACPPRFGAVSRQSDGPPPPPLPADQRTLVRKGKEN